MTETPAFTAEVYQNEYLPAGGQVVDAVITVAADGPAGAAATSTKATQVIMVDCSGSMAYPATRMVEAKTPARL